MQVLLNNKPIPAIEGISILALLNEMQLQNAKGIALAVNNNIIPKQQWESFSLSENDRITIIRATQGG